MDLQMSDHCSYVDLLFPSMEGDVHVPVTYFHIRLVFVFLVSPYSMVGSGRGTPGPLLSPPPGAQDTIYGMAMNGGDTYQTIGANIQSQVFVCTYFLASHPTCSLGKYLGGQRFGYRRYSLGLCDI